MKPPTVTQDDDEEPWSSLQHWQSSPAVPHLESVGEVHTVNLYVWLWNTFFMSVTISVKKILAFKWPSVLSHSWNKGLVCMKTERSILIHFIKCSHWLGNSRYILLNAYSLPATVLIPNIYSYSWREYLWGSFPCHQFPFNWLHSEEQPPVKCNHMPNHIKLNQAWVSSYPTWANQNPFLLNLELTSTEVKEIVFMWLDI